MRKHKRKTICAPPGFPVNLEWQVFGLGEVLAFAVSLRFVIRLDRAVQELYRFRRLPNGEVQKFLLPGARMPFFSDLLAGTMVGFVVLALCCIALPALHYAHYYTGSKSIYLMRRLPDRGLLHRQCWTLPLFLLGLCVLTAAVLVLLYYLLYRFRTPAGCLPV